jgi:predicted transcriptional regulator
VLVAVAIVGVSGLIYFFVFPEIRNVQAPLLGLDTGAGLTTATAVTTTQPATAVTSPYDSVIKTLTVDERKVIEVLSSHNGKYLQKYIRSEAGLNRLQTHRIVARLAERGIVSLEKTGNTNTVLLAKWLK